MGEIEANLRLRGFGDYLIDQSRLRLSLNFCITKAMEKMFYFKDKFSFHSRGVSWWEREALCSAHN